jgi:hypothetical protein
MQKFEFGPMSSDASLTGVDESETADESKAPWRLLLSFPWRRVELDDEVPAGAER